MLEKQEFLKSREEDADEDAKLMRRIGQGDEDALRALMRRHLGATTRLAARVLGPGAAEDVAQEAFLRVWKHAANFEDPGARGAKFTTWLYRIVVNLCIDEKRKTRFSSIDDIAEPEDAADGAEKTMARREQSARVRAALAALPERQRTAFVLCFYEDYSNKDAGAVMGIGVKALESLLVRARKTLRDALKEERN